MERPLPGSISFFKAMLLAALFVLIAFNAIGQDNQSLRFIENKGQWSKDIDFQAKVPGGHLGVSAKGFSILLLDMDAIRAPSPGNARGCKRIRRTHSR